MSAARPWRRLGDSDLASLRRGLEPLASGWAQAWLPGETMTFEVAAAAPHLAGEDALLVFCDGDDARTGPRQAVLYGAAQKLLRPVLADAGAELSAPMTQYILRDLLARLARLPSGGLRTDALLSAAARNSPRAMAADGSAVATLAFGRDELAVWMSHSLLSHLYEGRSPATVAALASRQEALAGRRLPFRLMVGSAELVLADLIGLEPGDVILLDAGIEQPLALENTLGERIARGYLGLRHGAAAIQICK